MDAVIIVDKPIGLTSFDVVARVRRILGERRVGHAGTLDPLASGVLIVCLGAATKVVPYLMEADKLYRATARLGVVTDTDDADPQAQVLYRAPVEAMQALRSEQVATALLGMVGELVQRPPRFSALKSDGQRLYAKARAARQAPEANSSMVNAELSAELDAKQRTVRVDAIAIESLDFDQSDKIDKTVTFTVRCGKGTYIRALARDLGEALGVGAHLTALRRLRVGPFDESVAVAPDPQGLLQAHRFTLSAALAHLPQTRVAEPLARRLRQGQLAALAEVSAATAPFTVLDPSDELVAIIEKDAQTGHLRIARGFVPISA
jgi:tRNA pseudouridine55 synthase